MRSSTRKPRQVPLRAGTIVYIFWGHSGVQSSHRCRMMSPCRVMMSPSSDVGIERERVLRIADSFSSSGWEGGVNDGTSACTLIDR